MRRETVAYNLEIQAEACRICIMQSWYAGTRFADFGRRRLPHEGNPTGRHVSAKQPHRMRCLVGNLIKYRSRLTMTKVTPFLMFQDGNAEEAMNYYTSLLEDSEITSIVRYGADVPGGDEGTVMQATFVLKGQEFMCI